MNEEGRTLKRRHLIYYLEVYNEENNEIMGHLVDLTTGGVKLVSKEAIKKGKLYKMYMNLPDGYFKEKQIHFEGKSVWSGNDVNPDFYDTGFEVPKMNRDARKTIIKLITWLGFND